MGKKRIIKKTAEELLKETATEKKEEITGKGGKAPEKKSKKLILKSARFYINSTYNNTIISVTDENGNVITSSSAGQIGFKGTKKSTPFAASKVAERVLGNLKDTQIEGASIFIKGIGTGRDSALRTIAGGDLNITQIKDITPTPFNGPRPPKVRRV